MNKNLPKDTVSRDENATCDRCGKFGAFHFGDKTLCAECYQVAGSCCLEFGGDDLWRSE